MRITSPVDEHVFAAGEPITYVAQVDDPQQAELASDAIVWRQDAITIGTGRQMTRDETSPGTHKIEATVTTSDGRSEHAQITIHVRERPNGAPIVAITAPSDNKPQRYAAQYDPGSEPDTPRYYKDIQITATADDPDGDRLQYRWTERSDPATVLSTQLSPRLRLYVPAGHSTSMHDLVLSVSDATHSSTASLHVLLYIPPPPSPPSIQ